MGLGFRVRAELKYQAHALGKTKSIRLISNVGMLVHRSNLLLHITFVIYFLQ